MNAKPELGLVVELSSLRAVPHASQEPHLCLWSRASSFASVVNRVLLATIGHAGEMRGVLHPSENIRRVLRDGPESDCLFVLWVNSHVLATMMAVKSLGVHLRGDISLVTVVRSWLDVSVQEVDCLELIESHELLIAAIVN